MGKLLRLVDIIGIETWYFEDAYFSHDSGTRDRYVYKWPSPNFPYSYYIHEEHLTNSAKIEIRRWIENIITDTVLIDEISYDYRRYYGESRDWSNSYEVRNRWQRFHFENEHTALMFKMTFSNLIKQLIKHHPDRPGDEEWCKKSPGER
jgi:hypothetical protein